MFRFFFWAQDGWRCYRHDQQVLTQAQGQVSCVELISFSFSLCFLPLLFLFRALSVRAEDQITCVLWLLKHTVFLWFLCGVSSGVVFRVDPAHVILVVCLSSLIQPVAHHCRHMHSEGIQLRVNWCSWNMCACSA